MKFCPMCGTSLIFLGEINSDYRGYECSQCEILWKYSHDLPRSDFGKWLWTNGDRVILQYEE